jgi:sortase A
MPDDARPRRKTRLYAALALLLVGVSLLGFVAWEIVGTTMVSKHRQQEIVNTVRQDWSQPRDQSGQPADGGSADGVKALVRIPRFGSDYVVPVHEGVDDFELSRGFGHYLGAGEPGGSGNYAVAGHRITHGEPLRQMPDLRPGDEVIVETRRWVFTYQLDTDPNALVIDFSQGWVLDTVPVNPSLDGPSPSPASDRLLTLTTCANLFQSDARMVVFGHLISSQKRSG